MKQAVFESTYAAEWQTFQAWVDVLARPRGADSQQLKEIGERFPEAYRAVCHHLALARSRRYSADLQERLNALALAGHRFMYRPRTSWVSGLVRFFGVDFPMTFRRYWRHMLIAFVLFYGPLFGLMIAIQWMPELVFSVLPPETVYGMESMYEPDNEAFGRERQSDTDLYMFGYYIYNNIGIGFRTFAGGLLFGIGSVFFLVFNGVAIGAVAGHLAHVGYTETFFTFVVAHGAFELTAICILGGAGLMLGYATLVPGQNSRWRAVQLRARDALPLVYGGTFFLLLAAFIEAFWSSTSWPDAWIKYTVGGLLWTAVTAYLGWAGRHES